MALQISFPTYQMNPMISAQQNANALSQQNFDTKIKQYQAKYAPQTIESQIAQANANAAKANIISAIAKSYFPELNTGNAVTTTPATLINNPNQGSNGFSQANINGVQSLQPTQIQNPNLAQGQTLPVQSTQLSSSIQQPTNVGSSNALSPNLNYGRAAIAGSLLGFGQPQIIDVNGTKMAVSPMGTFPVAQGLTKQQEAFQSGIGSYNAKAYGENTSQALGLQNQRLALDNLIALIDNPEFRNVTGPIQSTLKNWLGTREQQQLLGSLQSSSGEIALEVAPGLKGAFTGRTQGLINSIKANPNTDFPDVFIGKLKAQSLINRVLSDRLHRANQYINQGMPSDEANKKAADEIPLEQYRPQIEDMIKHRFWVTNKYGERKYVTDEEFKELKRKK